MKLIMTFVACVCLAQVCFGAPTGDSASIDSSEYLNNADIAKMVSDLKDIPGISQKSIGNFTDVLKKFRKNSTEEETMEGVFELLGMAVQGPTCGAGDTVEIDLNELMDESNSEESKQSKENKVDSSSSKDLTDDELKAMGVELEKLVNPEQRKHAMRILGAFRKGTTESEKNAAIMDLLVSAFTSLRTVC